MEQDKRLVNEIEHGKYLASEGATEIWNWESPAGKIRWQRRVKMLINGLSPGISVLELGCGTGYFTKEFVNSNFHVTAIDISPELIEQAINELKSENVTFEIQNAYQMTFANESFDAVIGSSVLHHLEIEKAVSEIYRILKPGGSIAFTEPNMLNPQIALERNIPWIRKKMNNSPDETAFFRWRMQKLLKEAGFVQIEIHPFDFLHPAIPPKLINFISSVGNLIEKIPLLKEIAGSLYIKALKHP